MTPVNSEKTSICIVSHNCYGAIQGGNSGFIGGVERQTSLLAWWLADRGHQVSLLTWDEGGESEEMIRGIRVIKICRQKAGFPGLRFFHPKWTALVRAMRRADAAVYYHNFSECVTGQVALWCRNNHRAFVFSAASDADCDLSLPELHSWREKVLYRYGLRHADRVIVQTLAQKTRMNANFTRDAVPIPMPCPLPAPSKQRTPDANSNRVLWIGRVCRVKRPDRLFTLARECRELAFDFVGPLYEGDRFCEDIRRQAETIPNVSVHGAIPRDRMHEFYERAAVLCCTSEYEGFPNTFLEAWSHGVPVVSTFDPDGVIAKHNLGRFNADPALLADAIRRLLASPEEYQEVAGNTRQYYLQNHTPEAVLPKVEEILLEAARSKAVGRSPAQVGPSLAAQNP